jgi:hypothetical protein
LLESDRQRGVADTEEDEDVADIPADAPRSDDGQWWWDGSTWQPVDGGGTAVATGSQAVQSLTPQEVASIEIDPQPSTQPDNRQALIDGATNEARGRLVMVRQDIDKAVNDFNSRAHDATEDLKGKSESDMGSALFKVLIDVAIAAVPGAAEAEVAYKLAEEVGKEAFKGFVDTWVDGVEKSSQQSAQGRLDDAKSELRRIATNLADAAAESAQAAEEAAAPLLGHSATQILAANPGWEHVDATQDNYGLISDHMGFVDPRASLIAFKISQHLDNQFEHEMTRVSADLYFHDMANDTERLMHLLDKIEPTTNVGDYLRAVSADVPWWERRVELYHATYPGEAGDTLKAIRVLETLTLNPEAGPDDVGKYPI